MRLRLATLLLLLSAVALRSAAGGEAVPLGEQTFLGPNGAPLALGFVYTYVPLTTTSKLSWQEPALSTPNANPIQLDANGQARLWGAPGDQYREVVLDATGALVWDQVVRLPGSVSGPASTIVGHLASWASVDGSLLGGDPLIAVNVNDLDLQPGSLASISSFNSNNNNSDYAMTTAFREKLGLSGSVGDSVGSFTDSGYFEVSDSDTAGYVLQHVVDAVRGFASGPFASGTWETSGKQLTAGEFEAVGASTGVREPSFAPGVSGLRGTAIQYSAGIGDNEFWARQFSGAEGVLAQSTLLVAVRAVIDANKADEDSNHLVYGVSVENIGNGRITAYYGAEGGGVGRAFLDGGTAKVNSWGIIMPGSTSGFAGTTINYGLKNGGASSYTFWDSGTNGGQYGWVDTAVDVLEADTLGVTMGPPASAEPTGSTGPFLYLATMAGTPTGVPGRAGRGSACAIDTSATKLWCYVSGAWKFTQLN